MTDYIVANCEDSRMNGLYIPDYVNDPPDDGLWIHESNNNYWLSGGGSYSNSVNLVDVSDYSASYGDNNNQVVAPDDPSIVWWNLNTDTASALTVTAAGGSDPPSSIINHVMHYRRLMSR